MIINLRGTNGSGKSTVIRSLMDECTTIRPIYGVLGLKRPQAYELTFNGVKKPTYLLGPYVSPSGGCDNLKYNQLLDLLGLYCPKGHVVFEGVLISSVYGAVGEFLEQYGNAVVFMLLDTPLEVCLARIESRRGGKPRDERLIKNVSGKYKSALAVHARICRERKMNSVITNASVAADFIINVLKYN